MTPTARGVALDALLKGGDAAEHLDRELRAATPAPNDRAFATELAYGTLKRRRSLEWSVSRYLTKPFAQLDPVARWVLLLGAYQLLYLDRVPAHSAVDESVSLARARSHGGIAALVNAVLRKVAASKDTPPKPSPEGGAVALGLHSSLPDWIAAHLIERFGFDDAVAAAAGMNAAPRRALRIDPARTSADALGGTTGRYGIPECVIVERASASPSVRQAFENGSAAWQSEESQLAVHLLNPQPGETILDVCSGRGVKTLMLARRMHQSGSVWSVDDDAAKLAALSKAAAAAGLDVVHPVRADARAPYPDAIGGFVDAALIDAPCTGLGVIGRRPDARWRKRPEDPARFAAVQAAVLRQAAAHVRSGGRLLYVTCSTHAAEDESVVDAFVAENAGWRPRPLTISGMPGAKAIGDYALTIPGIDGADGFFYALLDRAE